MAGKGESDVRMVYTAFAICHMLNDWSGVNIVNAVKYIRRCRVSITSSKLYKLNLTFDLKTYEGGYGQTPFNESQGSFFHLRICFARFADIFQVVLRTAQ